jgi:hypothetical protein
MFTSRVPKNTFPPVTLRHLVSLAAFLFTAALPCALSAKQGEAAKDPTAITVVRVQHEWRDAASFKRIAEYFDGEEHNGGEALRRSHPEQRSGYYFFVRVKNPGALRPAKAALHVVTSTSAEPVSYEFPVELRAGDTVFNIGLTGPDWPDSKQHPVAWKLNFLADDGQILATATSYLWEKPASK